MILSIFISIALSSEGTNLDQRLRISGALPLADYENEQCIISFENFQENEVIYQYQSFGHTRNFQQASFIRLVNAQGNPWTQTFPCPMTRENVPYNRVRKYRIMRHPENFRPEINTRPATTLSSEGTNLDQRLRISGALPLADYENEQCIISFENFQDNEVIYQYQSFGHTRSFQQASFINLVNVQGNPWTQSFPCPVSRENVPYNRVRKYRIMRHPENFRPEMNNPLFHSKIFKIMK